MSHKKRKIFNVEEKSRIIWKLENGESNTKIAKEYGISHSTISTIWKNKDKIKALFKNNSLNIKRSRTSEHKVMEEALLTWFKHQRANNVTISGPILQQKANEFAHLMGKENFKCSSSWIQRFRARHNIVFGKVCNDAVGVPEGVAEEWFCIKWPTLCEGYKPEEIFNADETGLFFNLTPDKILKFKGKQCKDGKLSKTRITVLVAANMNGSRKKKLLVIGKAKIPRCFKNTHSLPIMYENNNRSWMTSLIFEKWLRNWDAQLKLRRNKILLLIDNCPAHPVDLKLKCIKIVFLPPNVASVLQPINQGVIKALKTEYRKLQVLKMLQNIENGENTKSFNILDGILMISEAWEKVTQTTIASCFRQTGFKNFSVSPVEDDDDVLLVRMIQSPIDEDDNVTLDQLTAQLATEPRIEIEEFIGIDDNVAVCASVTDEEILSEVKSNRKTDDVNEGGELLEPITLCEAIVESNPNTDNGNAGEEEFEPITLCEAIDAITILQKFIAFNGEFNSGDSQVTLTKMKRKMENAFETQLKNKIDHNDPLL